MIKIINSTKVQQKMSDVIASIEEDAYIVTHRGDGKMVMLPYFEGCGDFIEDYMEDYEMMQNKVALQRELRDSLDSGISDLKI